MELKELFLEQLERDATACRKVLEQVPEGKNHWKPHEKSMELGYLASLVATMPAWPSLMIDLDELDLNGPPEKTFRAPEMTTRRKLLELLDASVEKSRRSLENTTEEHLMTTWKLVLGGTVLSEGPRYRMILDGAMTHLAHHRGQLTVYLRLNGEKVPAVYGPSADERF